MIRMLTAIAGNGFSVGPGVETDVFTEDEESRLVASGAAEEVKKAPVKKAAKTVRKAVAPTVETAVEKD